jgi:hypothetical protein
MIMPDKKAISTKPRRGRPVSTGRGITPTIYIPRAEAEALQKIASKKGITLGDVVREAIQKYIS